jgi:flagellar motility protein MotE (MotC chaperone)
VKGPKLLTIVAFCAAMLLGLKGLSIVTGGKTNAELGLSVAYAQENTQTQPSSTMDPMPAAESPDTGNTGAPEMLPERDAIEENAVPTAAEKLLDRLRERRDELEKRNADLDMRESLITAAEKRIEERLEELKALEARIEVKADEADAAREEEIKSLITTYENMRPKNAAAIFNDLELEILIEVARRMNSRKLADVMGRMQPEAARQLTIALAGVTDMQQRSAPVSTGLPRIQGTSPLINGPS